MRPETRATSHRRGPQLLCATHRSLVRPEDGPCVAGRCQGGRLEPFPIAVRDGRMFARDAFADDFE